MYLGTHCNIGSKRAFPTGVLDRWHNCLLIFWRNVAQHARPTSVCLLLRHDSAKRRRQWLPNFFSFAYSAQTVRPLPKLIHERHILGMSTSPRNDSHARNWAVWAVPVSQTLPKCTHFGCLGLVKLLRGNSEISQRCARAHRLTSFISKMLKIGVG